MKLFILLSFLACGAYAASSCGENQSYFECGSPCALTCKNYDNPPLICPAMCVSGCFCDKGYVKTDDGRCVRPEECAGQPEDICSQPVKSGVCLAYFKRFYFDKESGECKEFIYGGCQGNRNNFKSLEECQKTCGVLKQSVSSSDCSQYPDSGKCNAYMPRYYFDNFSSSCKTFMYGGCGGNRNNFRTEEERNAHCLGEYCSRQE